ncbi:MAG TPA: DUF5681 domain-containing protein [Rhizomicrobium sp.]|nr:DUF5681 domain-containing protein [Rhizomicrobium sp.]
MSDVSNGGGAVGYKRPPREHCWNKGQSGNLKGRPPGFRNFRAAVTAILHEQVSVSVDGEDREMTRLESVARQLVGKAEAGDPRLMQQLLAEIHKNEAKAERDASAQPLADADRQVIDAFLARLAREAASQNAQTDVGDTGPALAAHGSEPRSPEPADTGDGRRGEAQERAGRQSPEPPDPDQA